MSTRQRRGLLAVTVVVALAGPGVAVAGAQQRRPPVGFPVAGVGQLQTQNLAGGTRRYARTFYVRYANIFGGTLWRYNGHWRWYVRRGKIVRATHIEWPSSLAPGWSFRGSRYLHRYGRIGTTMVGRRTLGHFRWSIPGVGSVRNKYPWLDVRVHASGNHWFQWDDG